ncbi:MAG: methyltransferase domain-containing protein [Planctomycetota bacterium]
MGDLQTLYDNKYKDADFTPFHPRPDAFSPSRQDDVWRLLQDERGDLLEIGSGSGALSMALAEKFDTVVGLELSRPRVALSQQTLTEYYPDRAERVQFMAGSADQPLPFDDKSFDVVVACAVIEHLVDIYGVMDELARVCRPGGSVVITVPNICYIKHTLGLLVGKLPLTGTPVRDITYWRDHGWDGGHLHYFSKGTLGDLLEHVGFTPEVWTGDGKWARIRRWHPHLLGNLTVRARRRG